MKRSTNTEIIKPWVLLSSSSGETFEAIWKDLHPEFRKQCQGMLVDRSCGALDKSFAKDLKASSLGIQVFARKEFESKALEILNLHSLHSLGGQEMLGFLCGFFSILTAKFVEAFPGFMVNTHPSLLPAFPGLDRSVHEEVFQKVLVSGFSVHLVNARMDDGSILYQHAINIAQCKDSNEVREAVRQKEKKYLPKVLERILISDLSKKDLNETCATLKSRLWKEPLDEHL